MRTFTLELHVFAFAIASHDLNGAVRLGLGGFPSGSFHDRGESRGQLPQPSVLPEQRDRRAGVDDNPVRILQSPVLRYPAPVEGNHFLGQALDLK